MLDFGEQLLAQADMLRGDLNQLIFLDALQRLLQRRFSSGFEEGEDNADAHMKRQVMGREVVVAVTKGKLDFGPWEQIFYGEFDGNRPKRVLVKVIGE